MEKREDRNVSIFNRGQKSYLWYTAAFLVVATIVFCQLLLFQKTLIWNIDGYLQWYGVYSKFHNTITALFNGEGFNFWSWDIGLGSDFLSNFAFMIFDPFSYIALLFPKQNLDIAYTLIMILKLYTAGAAMLLFLRYHKKADLLCLIGAVGYAFCMWGLTCTRHDFFLTQMILFPILILGVDKIEEGHSPVTLIISIFFSVINSIYFSYMSALFVMVYILTRYFTSEEEKSLSNFMRKILKYVFYAITGGVLLAAPVLLPSFYALLSCSKESGVGIQLLPNLGNFLKFIPAFAGVTDVNNNYTVIGMNILFVLMIPAMFMQWKKKKLSCRMFIICLPFVLVPGLQSITNGFSYATGRWSYVLGFFFVYAAIECLEWACIYERKYIRMIIWLLLGIFSLSFVGCLIFRAFGVSDFLMILLNMMFAFIYCYILYESQKSSRRRLYSLTITLMANAALMGFAFYTPLVGNRLSSYMTQGVCHEIYSNSNLRAAGSIEDPEFYRVDTVDYPSNSGMNVPYAHTPVNLGMYWGVSSPTEYLSTLDGNWLKYNQLLGNNCSYFRRMCSYSNDNRSRLDFLLGIKYFFGNDQKRTGEPFSQYAGYGFAESQQEQGVSVLQSPYDVSLGYVYEKAIPDSLLMEYSPLEREQILMQCGVLSEKDLKQTEQVQQVEAADLEWEDSVTVPYQISTADGIDWADHGFQVWKKAAFTLRIEEENESPGELYLIFHNLKKKPLSEERLWEVAYPNKNRMTRAEFLLSRLNAQSYGNFSVTVTRNDIKKRFLNAEGEPQGIRNVNDYIVNLGYTTNVTGEIFCYFDTLGDYTYDSIELVSVPLRKYEQQIEGLTANRLHVTSCNGDYIVGEVDTAHGGLLYLSILHNNGWEIYVDGKKAEKIYQVNTAFTGVEVEAGKHQVELRYHPVGMPYTIVLFFIGIIIAILASIWFADKKRRSSK